MIDDEVIANIKSNTPFYKSDCLRDIFSLKEFEINLLSLLWSKNLGIVINSPIEIINIPKRYLKKNRNLKRFEYLL